MPLAPPRVRQARTTVRSFGAFHSRPSLCARSAVAILLSRCPRFTIQPINMATFQPQLFNSLTRCASGRGLRRCRACRSSSIGIWGSCRACSRSRNLSRCSGLNAAIIDAGSNMLAAAYHIPTALNPKEIRCCNFMSAGAYLSRQPCWTPRRGPFPAAGFFLAQVRVQKGPVVEPGLFRSGSDGVSRRGATDARSASETRGHPVDRIQESRSK